MYFEARHVSKTIQKVRSPVLDMGNLVHALALQPEQLEKEFSIEPEIPEGAFTTTATIRAFIDEYNAGLPPLLSADDIKALLEAHNAIQPQPVPMGDDVTQTGENYMALPAEFQRVEEGQKVTAAKMKACIKEYNATLPAQVKTSGSRDALLEQLALINPDMVAQEAQKAQPLKVSGTKPDACMAVVMQAARWGMDPFAVAQKTFIVGNSGVLGYEAQLVNAVINTMAPTKDRIHFEWFGAWENIVGRFIKKTSGKGNDYIAPGWDLHDEAGVGVRAWATLKGESEPRELVLMLSQAQVRNSTLWASDPRQQLAYLAVKRWARLYCPDVILGVYTADEIDEREERVINPAQTEKVTLDEITSSVGVSSSAQSSAVKVDSVADELRERIDSASSVDQAKAIRVDIESQKALLGTALYRRGDSW